MNQKYKFTPERETGLLSEEGTKTYFSRVGWAVFALGIASTLASAALSALAALVLPAPLLENSVLLTMFQHIITLISIYCVATPLFCFVLKPLPRIMPFREKMGFGGFMGGLAIAFFFMMIGNYISNIILIMIQSGLNISTQNPVEEAISPNDPWIVLLTVIFLGILFPILEELLFRKILCERLLPLGEGYAIFVSAAIFGLIHGNFYQFAYAFLLGALFALIYVKTGKLIYSTIYHILINLFGAVVTPWIIGQIDLTGLEKLLESSSLELDMELYSSLLPSMLLLMLYDAIMIVPAVFGVILLAKAKRNRTIRLEAGILPPPKKHKIANIFCTVGVAAAITFFAFTFVLSLL